MSEWYVPVIWIDIIWKKVIRNVANRVDFESEAQYKITISNCKLHCVHIKTSLCLDGRFCEVFTDFISIRI